MMLKQLVEVKTRAFQKFKEDYGEGVKLENGDAFVTVFRNAVLIVSLEEGALKTTFMSGKPYYVDMSLEIYEEGG